jgi:hypothetical protein
MPRGGLAAETLQEGLSWDALKDSVCVGARARPSAWAPFSRHSSLSLQLACFHIITLCRATGAPLLPCDAPRRFGTLLGRPRLSCHTNEDGRGFCI